MQVSIQVLNFDQQPVRTLDEDGRVLFCGSDVARALGYDEPHKAIARHCKADDGMKRPIIDSRGRTQLAKFIPEPDVYRLIIHSKLPSAERFERWVMEEVLPTIRRRGEYKMRELENENLMLRAKLPEGTQIERFALKNFFTYSAFCDMLYRRGFLSKMAFPVEHYIPTAAALNNGLLEETPFGLFVTQKGADHFLLAGYNLPDNYEEVI